MINLQVLFLINCLVYSQILAKKFKIPSKWLIFDDQFQLMKAGKNLVFLNIGMNLYFYQINTKMPVHHCSQL